MKAKPCNAATIRDRLLRAFTLIEVIGVLAVLAVLAALIVPNLLHHLDLAAGQQEAATLQTFGNALQSSITRSAYIPGATDWTTNIATELGMGPADVATNPRSHARVLLIDPAFQVGTNAVAALPYTQNINGSSAIPASPRLMILSTIGKLLPTNVVSGVPSGSDFSNIWNTADGTPPTGATGFSSWTANDGNDLKIQRINLSTLFIKLALSTYSSTTNGLYMVNPAASAITNSAPTTNGVVAYYLQNTVLRLINAPTNTIDSDQILTHDSSFVYNQNVWVDSLGTPSLPQSGVGYVGFDFNAIVSSFLAAPANPSAAPGATQTGVVNDMINYLQAYDAWAAGNCTSTPLYNAALSAQSTMMTDLNNLINGL